VTMARASLPSEFASKLWTGLLVAIEFQQMIVSHSDLVNHSLGKARGILDQCHPFCSGWQLAASGWLVSSEQRRSLQSASTP